MSAVKKSWRDVLAIHPAAELFPLMSEAELRELADDIKKKGMVEKPVLFAGANEGFALLDGRNRLDAYELNGGKYVNNSSFIEARRFRVVSHKDCDPYDYVMSANIHRRHLTAEQKRELIAKLLKARPEKTDRQFAKETGVSQPTVGKIRRDLEANDKDYHKPDRVEASGRKARGPKPGSTKKSKPNGTGTARVEPSSMTGEEALLAKLLPIVRAAESEGRKNLVTLSLAEVKCIAGMLRALYNEHSKGVPARVRWDGVEKEIEHLQWQLEESRRAPQKGA